MRLFGAAAALLLPSLARAALSAAAPWESLGSRDGIAVFRREVPGSPIVSLKGECLVSAPIGKVVMILSDTPRLTEWMDRLVSARVVRHVSLTERIVWTRTAVPWPLKDRDLVYRAVADPDAQARRLVIRMESVDDGAAPPLAGVVRSWMAPSLFTLIPVGKEATRVEVELQADPRGLIPKWVVNLFQRDWPRKTLEGLRRQAARPGIGEFPGVGDFFGL